MNTMKTDLPGSYVRTVIPSSGCSGGPPGYQRAVAQNPDTVDRLCVPKIRFDVDAGNGRGKLTA
jgi:hypothetical protein